MFRSTPNSQQMASLDLKSGMQEKPQTALTQCIEPSAVSEHVFLISKGGEHGKEYGTHCADDRP